MPFFPTDLGAEVFIPEDHSDKYQSKQKCPHCDRMFATPSGLLDHMSKYHTKEE